MNNAVKHSQVSKLHFHIETQGEQVLFKECQIAFEIDTHFFKGV